jgi:hypothetical protein
MKKNLMKLAAVAIAALTMASCATINSGAAISTNAPIGSKMGEAQSTIILGLWSSQGEQNNIKQAAANGGITKISHVEYIDQSIIGGIVIKHTTRVFGE